MFAEEYVRQSTAPHTDPASDPHIGASDYAAAESDQATAAAHGADQEQAGAAVLSGFDRFAAAARRDAEQAASENEHWVDDTLTTSAISSGCCPQCSPVIDVLAARITWLGAERIRLLAMVAEQDEAAASAPEPGTHAARVAADPAYRIAER